MWDSLSSDSWEAHTHHSEADVTDSVISIVFIQIYEVEFWLGKKHMLSIHCFFSFLLELLLSHMICKSIP